MVRALIYKLKRRLRDWLEVEAKIDLTVRDRAIRHEVHVAEITAQSAMRSMDELWTQHRALRDQMHKTLGEIGMTLAAKELEQTFIELGDLPCGCLNEEQHRAAAKAHTARTNERVARWLKWREREKSK